jgi:hypothetical protein
MNHRPAARHLGAAFAALLRLAFVARLQHATGPRSGEQSAGKRPARLKKNRFWRTWADLGGLLADFGVRARFAPLPKL